MPFLSSARKPYVIGAGVVAAAALLGAVSYTATKPDAPTASAARTPGGGESAPGAEPRVYPELERYARRDAEDGLALGRADAPVVLIEYADFKCGYCGKFARDTEPELIRRYVDRGVLRIEWRNFPIFGADSERAARAAWAAGQQGRFWQFHRAAYAEGAKEKGFSAERVAALAREAGVPDLGRFTRELDGEAARKAVAKDQDQGYSLGATSTPSFLVNGRPLAGAQPTEAFAKAIEASAAAAKQRPESVTPSETAGAGARDERADR
ncbi:DsbA family protein [Streptomyces sp. LP05-1]|uniref:DsbA family protein n=1 Tax=Streptomyces pyxinae TaxID=2970734 RepID=A0ABT2CNI5_9ACTN|nr:DsbA family protein [Streptomyces sp. LP05-1]MCS0638865.1 DsbA family protein [Streptomyces sp. LP05-1]